jgi:hypothetical protein
MATGATTNYFLPYPLSTDPVRIAGDIEELAVKIDTILNEEIEDAAALMWTGGTFTNGLTTPTYNDSTGKMSMGLAQDIRPSASPQFTNLVLSGDIEIRGGDATTNQSTFNLLNTNATTVNFAGAATTINIGSAAGTINSASDFNVASGKQYRVNNVSVLSSTALGTSVVSSSLTSVGTITSGTWSASFGVVSGENLTNLTAENLIGTIPSTVLGDSTVYIGTTEIPLNRSSEEQSLTGINSIDGSAATLTTARTIGMTGDVVWTSGSFDGSENVTGTSTISNDAVTYAKIQNISAQYKILGRISSGSGDIEELSPDNIISLINQASTAIATTSGGTGSTTSTGTGSVVLSDSPTFTGSVVMPSSTSIGNVSGTEISYLSGVTSSIQNQIDSKENKVVSINQKTDSYTLIISDVSKLIQIDSEDPSTLTIPADDDVNFPVGSKIGVMQLGDGQVSIIGEEGVSVNSFNESLSLPGKWSIVELIKISSNDWVIF